MKNQLFIFFLLLWLGCTPNSNYKINGTVTDNSLDGEYVYLQEIRNNQLITIDSALVENTKFSFRGRQETPVIREISFSHQSTNGFSSLVFVLQEGELNAVIDTVSYITGTEQNDRLRLYFEQLHYYQSRLDNLVTQYQLITLSDELTDSLQLAFQGWYDSIRNELNELSYDFILVNSNSIAGGLVFLQSYPHLTANQVATILDTAGPHFRAIHGVDIVEQQVRREKKVAIGNQYVDFTLSDPQGESITLSSQMGEGKWILLDFWASDCFPCEQEMPAMKQLYRQFHEKGLEIISISLDSDRDMWLSGMARNEMPWLQLSDLAGWENEAAMVYGIHVLPYTILIDPDGYIVAKGLRPQVLKEKLSKILLSSN